MASPPSDERRVGSFEPWMLGYLANGAGFSAFVVLLIPAFVTDVTGSGAEAGVVMAVISLAAVLGPVLGGFADRYQAHRVVYSGGLAIMAVGFLAFSFAAEASAFFAIDSILLGVGIAATAAVAPVLVVGTKLPRDVQARQLTWLNLMQPAGQLLGGAIMGAAAAAAWSYADRFLLAAAILGLAAAGTWLVSSTAARRVRDSMAADVASAKGTPARRIGLSQLLFSAFGIYLLILVASSVANNGITNQISNIMPNVYGVDAASTSTLVALAGLINLPLFVVAGRWMARSGGMPLLTFGIALRLVGAVGMFVLGIVGNAPILLVAGAVQVLYQGAPFVRFAQPVVGVRFSPVPAGQANGWVIGATAAGSFIGSLLGGILADALGFNSIAAMAAIAAGIGLALTLLVLWPAERARRQAERAAADEAEPEET
jgi:predicted MFS family arabinose efflux permease